MGSPAHPGSLLSWMMEVLTAKHSKGGGAGREKWAAWMNSEIMAATGRGKAGEETKGLCLLALSCSHSCQGTEELLYRCLLNLIH